MVKDGGKVLYSEPGVTTVLMVTQSFLSAHPDIVADLLKAQIQANDFIKSNPAAGRAGRQRPSSPPTPASRSRLSILDPAFKEITFTNDPDAASLTDDANQAVSVGLLKPVKPGRHLRPRPAEHAAPAAGQPARRRLSA